MEHTTDPSGPKVGGHLRLVSNRDTQFEPITLRTLPDGSVLRRIPIRAPVGGTWQVIWVTARERRLRVTVQVDSRPDPTPPDAR